MRWRAPRCLRRPNRLHREPTGISRRWCKPRRLGLKRPRPGRASWGRAAPITTPRGIDAGKSRRQTRLGRLPRGHSRLTGLINAVISTSPTSPLGVKNRSTDNPYPVFRTIRPMPAHGAQDPSSPQSHCHYRRSDTTQRPPPGTGTLWYTSLPGFPARLPLDR
jgi:hypothetical protein